MGPEQESHMGEDSGSVLTGDVGGTHARLAIYEVGEGKPRLVRESIHDSAAYDGLESVVEDFLRTTGAHVTRACIAVAGPIAGGVYRFPNLGWEIRAQGFGSRVGIPGLRLVNDFEAVGYGIPVLEPDDLATLQEGGPVEHGPIVILGAGTGLGVGYLVWCDGSWSVHASEGGHADFAPADPTQVGLLHRLRARHGHVSWERVVSGHGLAEAYAYLRDTEAAPEGAAVRDALAAGQDPGEVITHHALHGGDALCAGTLDLFVRAFGAQAGNLALTLGATGGVYIAGGIAPKILDRLREGDFLEAFRAKGRLADLMASYPVRVVVEETVGLLGAAVVAART
jgi:glucokinase